MKKFEKIIKEKNIKNIIFDFDGVILDSIPVKTEAFKKLFQNYTIDIVDKFIGFHLENGGMSRYEKIRYFFKELLQKNITEEEVLYYANLYSELTKQELSNEKYLIKEVLEFIKNNYQKYNFHIASGADENDLKYICDELGITIYFVTINGSPLEKKNIVKNIIEKFSYKKEKTILIGDSLNDYEAAKFNSIEFYKFNNQTLNV